MNIGSLMDTPRFCTAFAEWGACLVYTLMLKKKCTGWKLPAALTGMLIYFHLYHALAGLLPLSLWIPCMIGAIASMCVFLKLCCDISWLDAGFCCTRAFVLAELAASLLWQLYVWLIYRSMQHNYLVLTLLMVLVYLIVFGCYYLYERSYIPQDEYLGVSQKELSGSILIALGAFAISNISFIFPDTPFSGVSSSILYVRTLVDFGGLIMLVTQMEKREEMRMKNENQIMNVMLQKQYDQYRLSIDNVELLRREFHDLKHYMIAIRSEENPEKKEKYLSEMEQAIATQEAMINTGNHVLDVVLTTKNSYCIQNKITFTCMADGSLLSFMHVKDICSIFGNALDNAIECVSQFDDPEKRLISLSMYQRNQFLMIQFENYTESVLRLQTNALPRTTKSDQQYHGYGLKSIKAAAEKYGGSMTLHAEDNWFTLQILLPVTQNEK